MSETAKCPLCGKDPVWTYYPNQESLKISCCKVSIESHDLWNKYAAAMEYAKKSTYWFGLPGGVDHVEDARAEQAMTDAQNRVLEVFNAD